MARVSCETLEPHERTTLAVGFFGLRDVAETDARRPARLGGREAFLEVLLGGFFEVVCDFLVQVGVDSILLPQPTNALHQNAQRPHDTSTGILKKRETIPVACCHAASSTRSCLRPSFVNV